MEGNGRGGISTSFRSKALEHFGITVASSLFLTSHLQLSAISVYAKTCSHFSPLAPTAWSKPPAFPMGTAAEASKLVSYHHSCPLTVCSPLGSQSKC